MPNNRISHVFGREKVKTAVFTLVNVMSMALAFAITIVLTRNADPTEYGMYKYATNFILMLPAFFEFGLHFSCSRIVAQAKSDEGHPIVFVSLIILAAIGIVLTIGLYALVYAGRIFNIRNIESLGSISLVFPFVAVMMIKMLITQLYQGTGRIYGLSLFTLSQYLLLLLTLITGNHFFGKLTFSYALWMFLASNAVVLIPTLSRIHYTFDGFWLNVKHLYREVKTSGMQLYFSSLATTGAAAAIALIAGSVYGYEEYGYYALAISLAQFFTFISSSLSVVKFRTYVHEERLNIKDLIFMALTNIALYAVFRLLIKRIFFQLFPNAYSAVVEYLVILAIAYILNGMMMFFNRFFIARGFGKTVMINSFIVAAAQIASAAVLVPVYGVYGLVVANVLVASFNFILYSITYIRYERRLNDATECE